MYNKTKKLQQPHRRVNVKISEGEKVTNLPAGSTNMVSFQDEFLA